MMDPWTLIGWSLLAALLSVAYHAQMVGDEHLLCGWRRLLVGWEQRLRPAFGATFLQRKAYVAYKFITKSTRECSWCLAGQLALVHYIIRWPACDWCSFYYWFHCALHVGAAIAITPIIMKYLVHAIRTT